PSWRSAPASGSKVSLRLDDKVFASAAEIDAPWESRYDEYAWHVVPAATDVDVSRDLTLSTGIVGPKDVEVTNLDLRIPVRIRPSKLLRARYVTSDLLGDAGLAVGTVS